MQVPPLRKRLGQHHLVDSGLCRPVIDFLSPRGRTVVEIGPGGGVLTDALLAAGADVMAVELDLRWLFELGSRARRGLRLVAMDALDLHWERVGEGSRVTGNLPFNVGTPILQGLLLRCMTAPKAAFLVQREVADRLVASRGDSAYGALSVLVAARGGARLLGEVPADRFRPPPKVDGAFVGFDLQSPPLPAAQLPAFLKTVRIAFQHRRKTLRNSLAASWGGQKAADAVDQLRFGSHARAGELGLEDFLRLHQWTSSGA